MKRFMIALLIVVASALVRGYARMIQYDQSLTDTLTQDSTSYLLKEVVIRSSSIKRKADRFVMSVTSAMNKDGVELLKQVPGVWLSDERISINGSSGTKVYVDDREIKLTGELLIGYLRSLRSDDILRVEVLPMVGADKDADARGGAIHIIMRRSTERGLQGNLSLNSSFAPSLQSYQPGGSLSFHSGKWDVYGFASGTLFPQNRGEIVTIRDYINDERGFSSKTVVKQPSRYGTVRMGTVYTINPSNRVGVELEYIRSGCISPSRSYSKLSIGSIEVESEGIYRQQEVYNMYSGAVNYVHRLDTKGSVLKLLADYVSKDSRGNNDYRIVQQPGILDKDTVYRSRSRATYQIATADLSWKQQLHPKSFLQMGMKYTYTGMDDHAYYEGREADMNWRQHAAYGYKLDYNENIGALYGSYSLQLKRGSVSLGLRGEYTQTSNRTDHRKRNSWDWFPHIDGNFYFDEIHKWMLVGQYGRYVERPTFTALNPNRIQTSDYSYLIGNPGLRSTYINKLSVTLVYNFRYTLTIGGNLHQDLIRQFSKEDTGNLDISYITYENHNRENHWFVAISAPWQPTTWLNLNTNFVGVKQDIRMYSGEGYMSHYLYFANANVTFYLPSDYSVEGQYNGASRLFSGNSGIEPYYTFNLHVRKKWKNDCYVATLGVDNIANRRNSYFTNMPGYNSMNRVEQASSGRLLKFTFSWNFKHGKKTKGMTVEKQSSGERNRLEGK